MGTNQSEWFLESRSLIYFLNRTHGKYGGETADKQVQLKCQNATGQMSW
jgi:hypothetical protein